jgi:hypothetical protein
MLRRNQQILSIPILLGGLGLVLTLGFQNCSNEGMKAAWQETGMVNIPSDNERGTMVFEEEVPTEVVAFSAGDPFNFNLLPNQEQMLSAQLSYLNYQSYENAKAIAINRQGLGFVSLKASGDIEEATQTALETCAVIGGGLPCGIVAVGNEFVVGSAELDSIFNFQLIPETELNSNIPFLTLASRQQAYDNYQRRGGPKAMAISLDGGYFSAWTTSDSPISSVDDAARVVLERCELNAVISPCILYARNNNVVFDPSTVNRRPQIDYGRTTLRESIPGMRATAFTSLIEGIYIPQVRSGSSGVIYITTRGVGGYGYGSGADATARAYCEERANGHPCIRYAQNLNIIDIRAHLRGLQEAETVHCLAVPRASCQDHIAMGCSGESVYVINGDGLPQLTNCTE